MTQGVQRLLGLTKEPTTQTVACEHCGGELDFPRDEIGRTIERCTSCGARRLLSRSPAAAEAEQVKRTLAFVGEDNASHRDGIRQLAPRICEAPTCGRQYQPNAPNQRFCTSICSAHTARSSRK